MRGVKGCLYCSLYTQISSIGQEYRRPYTPFTHEAVVPRMHRRTPDAGRSRSAEAGVSQ